MIRLSRWQLVFGTLIVVLVLSIVMWRQSRTHGPFELVVVNDGEYLTSIAVVTIKTVPHLHSIRAVYQASAIVDAGQSAVLPRGYMNYHGAHGPPNLSITAAHPLLIVTAQRMSPVETGAWRTLSLGVLSAKRLNPMSVNTDSYWAAFSDPLAPTVEDSAKYLVRHFRHVGSVYQRAGGIDALEKLRPSLDIEVAELIEQFGLTGEMRRFVFDEYSAIFGAQDGV